MAKGASVDNPAHGAPSLLCRTPRLENKLIFTVALLYLAVCSSACGTSDGSSTRDLLQIPPWYLFRRTQCPPASLPAATFGKRSQQDRLDTAPCTCDTQLRILDLGSSRFPRYLPSVDCLVAASGCSRGILCKQRPYKVRVLRRRHLPSASEEAVEEEEESEEDDALPESLRAAWRFEEMDINVACECKSL